MVPVVLFSVALVRCLSSVNQLNAFCIYLQTSVPCFNYELCRKIFHVSFTLLLCRHVLEIEINNIIIQVIL